MYISIPVVGEKSGSKERERRVACENEGENGVGCI